MRSARQGPGRRSRVGHPRINNAGIRVTTIRDITRFRITDVGHEATQSLSALPIAHRRFSIGELVFKLAIGNRKLKMY